MPLEKFLDAIAMAVKTSTMSGGLKGTFDLNVH
jgi:hypothetical protein